MLGIFSLKKVLELGGPFALDAQRRFWMQLKAFSIVYHTKVLYHMLLALMYTLQHLVKMMGCIKEGDRKKFIEYFSGQRVLQAFLEFLFKSLCASVEQFRPFVFFKVWILPLLPVCA